MEHVVQGLLRGGARALLGLERPRCAQPHAAPARALGAIPGARSAAPRALRPARRGPARARRAPRRDLRQKERLSPAAAAAAALPTVAPTRVPTVRSLAPLEAGTAAGARARRRAPRRGRAGRLASRGLGARNGSKGARNGSKGARTAGARAPGRPGRPRHALAGGGGARVRRRGGPVGFLIVFVRSPGVPFERKVEVERRLREREARAEPLEAALGRGERRREGVHEAHEVAVAPLRRVLHVLRLPAPRPAPRVSATVPPPGPPRRAPARGARRAPPRRRRR